MAKTVQFLGMPASQAGQFTGLPRQVIVDTNAWTLRVQDGITPGGFAALIAQNNFSDLVNVALAKENLLLGSAADHAATDFDAAGAASAAQTAAIATAEAFATAADTTVLSSAHTYTDTGVAAAEAFATAADVTNLNTAKAYADGKFLPLAGGTLTGALITMDAAVWNAAGIKNLVALGIGCVPTYILDVVTPDNVRFTGSGTQLVQRFKNSVGEFGYIGDAKDVISTGLSSNDFAIKAVGDLYAAWGNTSAYIFIKNTTEVGRFGTDGSFLLGSTSNAGAGSIGASGTITQAYSDMRLKTYLGPIENPIDKVMQLEGFYYEPNEKALSYSNSPYTKGQREVGLSAQDVQKVLPELIKKAPIDPEMMTIQYERLVALLVEVVKNQELRIRELEK